MKKILVVSPHPDDEILGAGGYLLKHKKIGDEIFWLIVTNIKEEYGYEKEKCEKRQHEIKLISKKLGIKKIYMLDLEPAGLDKYESRKVIKMIFDVINDCDPNTVILPDYYDAHTDHRITYERAMACLKSFRSINVQVIMCMQILSETDYSYLGKAFNANYFVDIEREIDDKIDLMRIYSSELFEFPFPRSEVAIRALAKVNGASSMCKAAEAFKIIKCIERNI